MSQSYDKRTTLSSYQAQKIAIATTILLPLSSLVNALYEHPLPNFQLSQYGYLTEYGSALVTQMPKSHDPFNRSNKPTNNIIYINAEGQFSKHMLENMRHALSEGAVIIFDGTETNNNISQLSAGIGGIGFNSPVLMVRHDAHQRPEYKALSFFSTEESPFRIPEYNHHKYRKMATETYAMLASWTFGIHKKSASPLTTENVATYRPESTINVELRHTGFPCMVGKDYEGNSVTGVSRWDPELTDACNESASVSLFYTVDFIRSIATDEGDTEDAKYVRVTLNPGGDGGAGWHFAEKPTHKTLWLQSQTNRIEWFGPIVEDYSITLATRDPEIRLFQTVPGNKPQHSNIVALPSIGVGVMVPGGISLPATSPTLGLPLSVGATTDRTVIYKNYEYAIINRSNDDVTATASWLWSREFDKYSEGWRTNSICSLWCSDPFFDDNAFTPAAYAHFSPGFSATFRAPAEKMDQSAIRFTGTANVVALGGRVQYKFLLQHYSPWSRKGTNYSFAQHLTVNWGSTLFNPEIPVSIEAFRENSEMGLCLNITESDIDEGVGQVDLYNCHFKNSQIWGMDAEHRYKSLLAQNLCLTREGDNTVTVRECTHSANQKWEWQQDKLASRLGGYLTAEADGTVSLNTIASEAVQWRSFPRKPEQTDILTIQSIPINQTP